MNKIVSTLLTITSLSMHTYFSFPFPVANTYGLYQQTHTKQLGRYKGSEWTNGEYRLTIHI